MHTTGFLTLISRYNKLILLTKYKQDPGPRRLSRKSGRGSAFRRSTEQNIKSGWLDTRLGYVKDDLINSTPRESDY